MNPKSYTLSFTQKDVENTLLEAMEKTNEYVQSDNCIAGVTRPFYLNLLEGNLPPYWGLMKVNSSYMVTYRTEVRDLSPVIIGMFSLKCKRTWSKEGNSITLGSKMTVTSLPYDEDTTIEYLVRESMYNYASSVLDGIVKVLAQGE